jgi:hypothetical protein
MAILVDTNILLRISQPDTAQSAIAEHALDALRIRNEELSITSQNLVEFWAVATRPLTQNGLGFTFEQAKGQMFALKQLFTLLP